MDTCFKAFDKDEDGFLNQSEFSALCRALFRNECGKPYHIEPTMLTKIFQIFDTNKDNVIDKDEFRFCWQRWIKQVVRPVTALLVVDVQNDFISGSLAIINCPAQHRGEEVIPPINKMLEEVKFDTVVYTLDWHTTDHVSFLDNVTLRTLHETNKVSPEDAKVYDVIVFDVHRNGVPMEQKMWPRHCVQGTWGSQLHQDLKMHEDPILIYKGTDPDVDSYSAFWDNKVSSATAKHAIEAGYRTLVVDDACRGVCADDICSSKEQVLSTYGMVIKTSQVKSLASGRDRPPVKSLASGRDRPPVLGYKLALELSKELASKPPPPGATKLV
ncbi:uncharacterized protein LOC108680392 [Hyalella azteca]|uniref:nicotinamidase n=1 Tax=Hyalella azteca TaxID=294128 RepID=A0A979FXU5_HYAAZ|nr:uncharacterized protein LOC108680392 [Hyalella azteca]